MRIPSVIRCAVLAVIAAGVALATDVTGKWTGDFAGPDGSITITFNFRQEGTKLTGTSEGPGVELQIKDGKVEGDKIVFNVSFDAGGGEMKIVHEGTVNGDEIKLNVKTEGGGDGPNGPMTLKRAK